MNSERMKEVEINVATHIKNPYYREKFCRDGYAKILLLRLNYSAGPAGLSSDSIKYAQEYIAYIDKYCHGLERTMSFHITYPTGYYFTFNSDGIPPTTRDIRNRVYECRLDFEQCYDDAKFRSLSEPEEEIANSIEDEDQKENFVLDIEAKTLYNLISMHRYESYNNEKINEAVDQYVAFIRDKYGIQVNIDRRKFKSPKIKRNIYVHDSSDTDHNTGTNCDSISNNVQMDRLFVWLTKQVHDETNREAREAYSRVLDAIKVICNEDRFNRLSIDEKIAIMHFLEDEDEVNNILKHQK